jgi:uncharacterized Rmd1/YagE family protein
LNRKKQLSPILGNINEGKEEVVSYRENTIRKVEFNVQLIKKVYKFIKNGNIFIHDKQLLIRELYKWNYAR